LITQFRAIHFAAARRDLGLTWINLPGQKSIGRDQEAASSL
jgi:hypothetical protein